jgi:hypothetical protein
VLGVVCALCATSTTFSSSHKFYAYMPTPIPKNEDKENKRTHRNQISFRAKYTIVAYGLALYFDMIKIGV